MKQKKVTIGFVLFLAICLLCVLTAVAESASIPKLDTSKFSRQSTLYFFDDGSWVYSASCSPIDDARYQVNVDFRCWGTDVLTYYPQMSVVIWDDEYEDVPYIVANKLTIKVAGNAYEYQLVESDPPWNSEIRVGVTFLLPSDEELIKDLAYATECTLVAETSVNTFTWVVTEEDYVKFFLPYVQDMLKYDFLHNVANSETNDQLLIYSPARKVYKNVGSGSAVYDSGPEPEEGYSFSEDPAAIEKAINSVFYIETYDEEKNYIRNASGFVSFDEHYFVTNEHILDGASYLVAWDINDYSYILDNVIAIDKDHDIAIFDFPEGIKYTSLKLDTLDNLKRGMPVVAIGSKGLQVAYSTGIIGAFPELEQYSGIKCIQYSAPTYIESNGGCLLGDNGKVIGITSAISSEGQYIGAAIPVKYLIELYSKKKSNAYDVMDTSGSSNSDTLEENGKKKEDPTIITGGKINTLVAIPRDFDLTPYIKDTMNMTVQEFYDAYDKIRKTTIKNAPAMSNRQIVKRSYIESDCDNGVGTRLFCAVPDGYNSTNLDIPLSSVQIIYRQIHQKGDVTANTRATLMAFTGDAHLLDKMLEFFKTYCDENDDLVGLITSEGYLIVYVYNSMGYEFFNIYNVAQ